MPLNLRVHWPSAAGAHVGDDDEFAVCLALGLNQEAAPVGQWQGCIRAMPTLHGGTSLPIPSLAPIHKSVPASLHSMPVPR